MIIPRIRNNILDKLSNFVELETLIKYHDTEIQNHNKFSYYPPILILNSLSTYKSCNDLSYLNTLLQFFIWEDIGYVSYKNINCKKNYSGFHELYYYPKKNKIILEECIINFKLLKESKYNSPVKLNNATYNDILIFNNKNKLFL